MYTGQHTKLRPFELEDANIYKDWINSSEIMHLVDRVLPVTNLNHNTWYENIITNPSNVIFAIETLDTPTFIGCVWLYAINQRHRNAEIRIIIGHKDFRGKGLGVDSLQTIVKFAFDHLNLHKVYAFTLAHNKKAQMSFKKAGFAVEGTLKQECFIQGKYMDMVRLALIKEKS